MACRLFSAIPLYKPLVIYHNLRNRIQWKADRNLSSFIDGIALQFINSDFAPILSRGGVGVLTLEIPKYLATLQASHAHQIRLMNKCLKAQLWTKFYLEKLTIVVQKPEYISRTTAKPLI